MKNIANMMKQAQEAQQKFGDLQARLEETEVSGASGGGMVKVTMTAKGSMKRVQIDPSLIVPADVGVLEDLIVTAVNDARTKGEAMVQEETQKIMGGLGLPSGLLPPGLKLPF
jgi:nucleoid-associated protein EbfC